MSGSLIFQCATCEHIEDNRAGITTECPYTRLDITPECLIERIQVDDNNQEIRTWIA